jgi:small subunit ribosomal protein S3
MGQKVNPIGLRLGISRGFDSRWYAEKEFAALLYEDYRVRRLIKRSSESGGISRIEIERTADRVRIGIHTARPGIIIGRGGKGIEALRAQVEELVGSKVQLNVIEIRHPELDAQLVAESVAQQLERRVSPRRAMRQAVMRSMRAGAKGVRVMCAGRLGGAEMARREDHKDGSVPLHTLRADIDYGFAEAPTTYGHIGVKTWIYRGEVVPGEEARQRPQVASRVPDRTAPARRSERRPRTGRIIRRRRDKVADGAAGDTALAQGPKTDEDPTKGARRPRPPRDAAGEPSRAAAPAPESEGSGAPAVEKEGPPKGADERS